MDDFLFSLVLGFNSVLVGSMLCVFATFAITKIKKPQVDFVWVYVGLEHGHQDPHRIQVEFELGIMYVLKFKSGAL